MLLAAALYFVIGSVFALPSNHLRAWRLAAWAISGVVYAVHIAYEHFWLRSSPRQTAWRAALAVGIGATAFAVAGMIHSLKVASSIRPAWLLALILWPIFTAVPAFLGAWAAGAALRRFSREGPVRF